MYYFNKQVDFKISSKLIPASKGHNQSVNTSELTLNFDVDTLLITIKVPEYLVGLIRWFGVTIAKFNVHHLDRNHGFLSIEYSKLPIKILSIAFLEQITTLF